MTATCVALLGACAARAATWEKASRPDGRTAALIHLCSTADGGVAGVGLASEIRNVPSAYDAIVMRLDPAGVPLWERTYGRPGDNDEFRGVVELANGDLIVAGTTQSLGPDSSNPWVLRLDGLTGDIVWQEYLSGEPLDARTVSLALAPNGSVVLSATASLPANGLHGLVIVLDGTGALVWQQAVPGLFDPMVSTTADGGFLVAGASWSGSGAWIARLDGAGAVDWQQSFTAPAGIGRVTELAASGSEAIVSIQALVASESVPAFVKLDPAGAITWQGSLDLRGGLEGVVATPAGIAATGAIGLPAGGLAPVFVRIDPSGALVTQEWFDPDRGILLDVAATPSGYVLGGELFLPDAQEWGAWTLGLDAAGNLDAPCAIAHPLSMTLWDPQMSMAPATLSLRTFALAPTLTNIIPGSVASAVTTQCSAASCVTPTATISGVTPLPACEGSVLRFFGVGSGNLPLTFDWDFDYTGLFTVDATGPDATHAFAASGAPTVALRVTDSCGATGPREVLATQVMRIHDCPPAGDATWAITLGGDSYDEPYAAFQSPDGGFIIAGGTASPALGREAWAAKVDGAGQLAWSHAFRGGDYQDGAAAALLASGDMLFLGERQNWTDGSIVPWATLMSTATGQMLSERVYGDATDRSWPGGLAASGGTGFAWCASADQARWIVSMTDADTINWQQRIDDPAITFGEPSALDVGPGGNVVSVGSSGGAAWAMSHDATGAMQWQSSIGGAAGPDFARDVVVTATGSAFCGTTAEGAGNGDGWFAKLDPDGSVAWQVAIGGADVDELTSLRALPDGGFIVAGWTASFGDGSRDAWLVRLDSTGVVLWQRAYGGPDSDFAGDVVAAADGSFLLVASTASFGAGIIDAWLVKLDSDGLIGGRCDLVTDTTAVVTPLLGTATVTALTGAPGARAVTADLGPDAAMAPSIMLRCATSLPGPPPLQPDLLDVTVDGNDLLLHFTFVVDAETYNFYEFAGTVVGLRPPVQTYCHETAANPAFTDLGDGTGTFRLTPSRDLTSYLVSASNWIGESPLSMGSGGEVDYPPSPWRCGANP